MTLPLSTFISDNFIIVDSTGDTGFNTTVWRGKVGAPYADNVYVSMRGTQGGFDLAQDFELTVTGVASIQMADRMNWWLIITTPVNQSAHRYKSIYLMNYFLRQEFSFHTFMLLVGDVI